MPFTDELLSEQRIGEEFAWNIGIAWCKSCHTAQNLTDIDVVEYYRDYQYTVSGSIFARRFMNTLAERSFCRFGLQEGDIVIEIGSGDGFQLQCFKNLGARVLGFEPSDVLAAAASDSGIPTVQKLFDCEGIEQIPVEFRPAQVVLLTYTFDHLPDPKSFLELTRRILDPYRGLLLIEVHDFTQIVSRREVCLFEHEHTIYLTSVTMGRLLERCGFKLIADDIIPSQERRGNSLLVAAVPETNRAFSSNYTPSPDDLALENMETIRHFERDAQAGIKRLQEHVNEQKSLGRHLAGYGAGGRGVMTLAMAGLTHTDIDFLCDQNQAFHGLYTPITHIPIRPPAALNENPVDELIVFSYGYLDEIRAQYTEFLGRGGRITSILDLL